MQDHKNKTNQENTLPHKALQEVAVEMKNIIKPVQFHSLNDCADEILKQLDPAQREFAIEVSDVILKIPRWQMIAGALTLLLEQGNMTGIVIDSRWQTQGTDIKDKNICRICGKEFTSQRLGQIYCSNQCGKEAEDKKILTDRQAKKPLCPECRKEIILTSKDQIFCSDECEFKNMEKMEAETDEFDHPVSKMEPLKKSK